MQLGFVSAILGELSIEEVMAFAADEGFGCVEVMCWPPAGGEQRRYAGVAHIDVTDCDGDQARHLHNLRRIHNVSISALGYYPNPLDPDPETRAAVVEHLKCVIRTAPRLGVHVVNTFLGRDPHKSVEDNWPLVMEVWPSIVEEARNAGVRLGIENCPMLFSKDEWPGGKNLAGTPAAWRKMFADLGSDHLGLNFDPSHLVWQHLDVTRCIREFGRHFVHVHAKDTRIDHEKLYEVGTTGLGWHVPKLPGLGDIDWRSFFSALSDARFDGAVCIEAEDRAYEGTLEMRKRALRQSKRYLEQFVSP